MWAFSALREVAFCPFSVHFTENERLLDLVGSPGDTKISNRREAGHC